MHQILLVHENAHMPAILHAHSAAWGYICVDSKAHLGAEQVHTNVKLCSMIAPAQMQYSCFIVKYN